MQYNNTGEFLPIGTVITLKNGNKRIMICGRLQERQEDHKIFDYVACLYPEGILAPDELFLFDHEDIDQIFFVGLEDGEEFAFREFLIQQIRSLQEVKK